MTTPLNEEALAKAIMWKDLPFGGDPETYVRLDANAAHAVIRLLKTHLSAVPADTVNPSELNRRGWTCGCEPGSYDTCEECQSACNELAGFLNRPVVGDA